MLHKTFNMKICYFNIVLPKCMLIVCNFVPFILQDYYCRSKFDHFDIFIAFKILQTRKIQNYNYNLYKLYND